MTTTPTACPDAGVWRAWLDHQDSPAHLQAHLEACPGCRGVLADLRGSAAAVGSLFDQLAPSSLPTPDETTLALDRLRRIRRQPGAARTSSPGLAASWPRSLPGFARGRPGVRSISTAWRIAASSLAAAIAVSVVVAFTPEGRTAAASFLSQFRSQQVVAIDLSPQSQADIARTMNALGNLGTVQAPAALRSPSGARAAEGAADNVSLAAAGQALGFAVETPDPAALPAGVDKTPKVQVIPASQVRFTFDTARARAYYQSTGHPEVTIPDRFNGATLVVSIPSAAILQYGGSTTSRQALVVGEAGDLVVDVQGGVSLAEMRDFLLSLPGLNASTVSQLRQITNWNSTLPIPVPIDRVNWQPTTINGAQGLLLNDNSGAGSALIWHARTGHLIGMAGSLKARDLQAIAESIKERSN